LTNNLQLAIHHSWPNEVNHDYKRNDTKIILKINKKTKNNEAIS
jgi:hypothetical protein